MVLLHNIFTYISKLHCHQDGITRNFLLKLSRYFIIGILTLFDVQQLYYKSRTP